MGLLGGNEPNIKLNTIYPSRIFYLTAVGPSSQDHSPTLLPRSIVLTEGVSSSSSAPHAWLEHYKKSKFMIHTCPLSATGAAAKIYYSTLKIH